MLNISKNVFLFNTQIASEKKFFFKIIKKKSKPNSHAMYTCIVKHVSLCTHLLTLKSVNPLIFIHLLDKFRQIFEMFTLVALINIQAK